MSATTTGNILKRVWYTFKSYRLPWRRQTFIGMDLDGNTYWEMNDTLNRGRPRRMVKYKDYQRDYVDYKLTPQWHQWLRATRTDPPTIAELEGDIVRIQRLKVNAALADARWAAKPSLLNVGPHPPADSVLESNTKFAGDSGMMKDQTQGRGEVGSDLGGKNMERKTVEGESTAGRAHGSGVQGGDEGKGGVVKERDPWKNADNRTGGFMPGEWIPNRIRR
ncbi:uncharacterized protein LAJ45_08083 [Morchella importuna]|uniref:Uncharacterized protein n=1 Tax=Morchella conica CCBAS932 TaxID=1392247 RepID=A0A3N4KVJ7_9PEZI|nr:uncharacterized protein LAJ45_08083 [Morchella importuna]KAH8147981.1 hypothetical protein LAJ45_08083 [Morchella importuna]RPB13439.1 hypothetical protein P167DRAFT_535133 [Morchella conica CCBAS932]